MCNITDADRELGFLCRSMDCPDCINWRERLEAQQRERLAYFNRRKNVEKDQDVNLNNLAGEIAKIEGGHQNLSIAQIKEVMKCYHKVLKPILADKEKEDIWFKKVLEA